VRFLAWTGVEEWLAETASVELGTDRLSANGTQIGADPVPYRVDYRLAASDGFLTRELELTATAEGWQRHLLLRHDAGSSWWAEVHDRGEVPDGPWDGELPELEGALDVDIAYSPLTNTMPIRRHGLQSGGGVDLTMAFVTVPTLRVAASPQRYEHVRAGEDGSVIRYLSRDGDFTAELELDNDGLVVLYPRLARRVEAGDHLDARG
jgi:uncharacterized protein